MSWLSKLSDGNRGFIIVFSLVLDVLQALHNKVQNGRGARMDSDRSQQRLGVHNAKLPSTVLSVRSALLPNV